MPHRRRHQSSHVEFLVSLPPLDLDLWMCVHVYVYVLPVIPLSPFPSRSKNMRISPLFLIICNLCLLLFLSLTLSLLFFSAYVLTLFRGVQFHLFCSRPFTQITFEAPPSHFWCLLVFMASINRNTRNVSCQYTHQNIGNASILKYVNT